MTASGQIEDGIAFADRAIEIAEEIGDEDLLFNGLQTGMAARALAGRSLEVLDQGKQALPLLRLEAEGEAVMTLGAIEARIRVDATQAKDEFLALAKDLPDEVTDEDFSFVGQKFAGAEEFMVAIDILDAGMKTHTDSAHLEKLKDNIRTAAERAGAQDALDKMAGLGYL